jgi:hypothetical protein
VSTRRDVGGPLQLAAAQALIAHRALGRMSVSATVAEFSAATLEFMSAARGVSQTVAVLALGSNGEGSDRRRAFTAWFAAEVAGVLAHPMQSDVVQASSNEPPVVYVSRPARGSDQPPVREAVAEVTPVNGSPIGRLAIVTRRPRPEDFYFEGADKRPAIELCAEYLDRVTTLLDESKATLRRLGLE